MNTKDKIRSEHIRGTTKVARASTKIMERRFKWCVHLMRREEEHDYNSEESDDERDTWTKEESDTEDKMEGCV